MKRSADRILTTHGGALRRPHDLAEMISAKDEGEPVDDAAVNVRIRTATHEAVRDQTQCGVDVVNDGEFPKISWAGYYISRLQGIGKRPMDSSAMLLHGRDSDLFPGWYALDGRMRRTFL